MDPLATVYKTRGDVLEALLDKMQDDLTQMLEAIKLTRAALAEQDQRFKLTAGKGGRQELIDAARKTFPQFANATDEEIANAFARK